MAPASRWAGTRRVSWATLQAGHALRCTRRARTFGGGRRSNMEASAASFSAMSRTTSCSLMPSATAGAAARAATRPCRQAGTGRAGGGAARDECGAALSSVPAFGYVIFVWRQQLAEAPGPAAAERARPQCIGAPHARRSASAERAHLRRARRRSERSALHAWMRSCCRLYCSIALCRPAMGQSLVSNRGSSSVRARISVRSMRITCSER